MKKTFLFAAVSLFSVASFAQTSVKNSDAIKGQTNVQNNRSSSQLNSSANASSATTIHSNAVKKAENKSSAEIKSNRKAIVAEKQAMAAEAKAKGQETAKTAREDHQISTSVHSNSKVHASANRNQVNGNTSVNSSETISSAAIKNRGNEVKTEEKANIRTTADGTVETGNRVKTGVKNTTVKAGKKIKSTSSTAVHAGATTVNAVKIRPVRIKAATNVRTNTGIKL